MSLSRRDFLSASAATAAVTLVGTTQAELLAPAAQELKKGPGNKWEGRVVVNFNKEAASGLTASEAVIKKMVNDSILLLTGMDSIGAAWKAVFPSTLSLQSKIAIKINILNSGNPAPHPFSVMAITEGLQLMDFNGTKFSPANITIYDMNNSSTMDRAGYTAMRFPNIARVKDTAQVFGDGALSNRSYAKTLHDADFLINVFSPRGHNTGSTFTIGFKSHYGTYSNPNSLHGSNAPSYLRDINCTGPVYNKTVLSMCSGIFGMNEGNGPGGGKDDYSTYSKKMDPTSTSVNPTTIIMSTDPVACDMQTIKMMRMNNGKSYALPDLPAYLKASAGIQGALSPSYNIGIIDEGAMDVRRIINGEKYETSVKHSGQKAAERQLGISSMQLKGQNITHIEFRVPASDIGAIAAIDILTLNGARVQRCMIEAQGIVNNFSWDQRDTHGEKVQSGTYVVSLKVASGTVRSRTVIMQ